MFAVALIDDRLLENLRVSTIGAVANFWTPTPWNIRGLQPGNRLYFLLKSPIRKIAGHGDFGRYTNMRASIAWNAYGVGNGVGSFDELVGLVDHFAGKNSKKYVRVPDPEIGCIELTNPVFYPDDEFISPDAIGLSIPSKIVKIKYFSVPDPIRSKFDVPTIDAFALIAGVPARKASSQKKRVRASAFRRDILANYEDRCCVTAVALPELLEASHIQPYINEGSNHPQNGLCLRVDLHCLFDAGLITLDTGLHVILSKTLRDTIYQVFEGKAIKPPTDLSVRPAQCALEFHRSKVFRPL
jgi:putative restriction endonuclease